MPDPAKASPALSWLHLSDLHACSPKFDWDAGRVTETLVADLRCLQADHGLRPDLIFFTGDAAFGQIGNGPGQTLVDQYAHFATFLEAVRTAFEPEIALDNIFLVPGNHDVDRGMVTPAETSWLDQQKSIAPVRTMIHDGKLHWQRYVERLAAYRDFLERHGLTHLLKDQDPERLIWATVRAVGDLKVGIAGFNSAWSCCRNRERGRLWMAGQWQQGMLRQKLAGADFSVALVHHPPDWLVEYETPDFGRQLEQDFRFLLHGHEHRAWVLTTDDGYTVLAAAACYEHSDSERNGYSLVRLDPASGSGEVWLRRYEASGGGWIGRQIAAKTDERGVKALRLGWLASLASRAQAAPEPAPAPSVAESSSGAMDTPAVVEESSELSRYLQRLRAACRDLPVAGFETNVRMPIHLDQVYIPLRARVFHELTSRRHKSFGPLPELEEEAAEDRDVPFDETLELAARHDLRGVVVLGDPGSGKTTLLKHFVLAVTDPLIGPAALGLPPATVPVLIELRRLRDPAAGLRAAIETAVAAVDLTLDAAAFTQKYLCRDHLLVLVDGLDEIADADQRATVSRWLEAAIERHLPHSTFVVSSRYAGYKGDARLSGRFLELHVRGVEADQARRFIAAWYAAVESRAELDRDAEVAAAVARQAAEDLSGKIFDGDDPRVANLRKLARNPLMLQILCLVHRDRKSLPKRRVELYRECVVVLLELWRRAKGMPPDLEATQALRLLRPVAWRLHTEDKREAQLSEILPVLIEPLRELQRPVSDGALLLEAIRDQTGVLVSLGQSAYAFLHLSFQEYLSALHVQDRVTRQPEILDELAGRFGDPWWREVILLCLGLDAPSLFEPLMAALVARGVLPRDPGLADDCLRDALVTSARPFLAALQAGSGDATERYHVLRLLRALSGWQDAEVEGARGSQVVAALARSDGDREVRGLARELLGQEGPTVIVRGDAREEENAKDGSVLVYVPGGEYTLGAEDITDDEKPIHTAILSPYWIGKYAVTNAQYRLFVEATNHHAPELWDDEQFNQPEQPVVGVSWQDALAYCQWAGLALPSEAQWEAAARGMDQRRYPWGNEEPSAEHANFDGREGKTTPVGSYPEGAGPYGTLDQAGNVWEWCADEWNATAYHDREGQRDPVVKGGADDESSVRVLRGGSWFNPARHLPSAFRFRVVAWHRYWDFGFRVCRFRPEP